MFALHTLFIMLLSFILVVVLRLTNFGSDLDSTEKMTAFECGFDPLSEMRSPFSTRFFLLVVLFLIFDVEIALLFPILSAFSTSVDLLSSFILTSFLALLLLGMFHEWNEGALDWFST
uniref:NADH-ubiquinone oxidoreductase chain 3 n=1 Tax=Notodoris gardineri TaxID=407123 RepID=E6Y1A2_NOTGA|nr:NADH dehydrogenase subunit 3 [Notodoris gardineri]ABL09055.1 NADH dehydrogenase subunit 3 [Notodoris gardineri]